MSSSSVTMFVMNNCHRDARVLKEAESLTAAGYSVRVIALLDKTTVVHEMRSGFAIDRVIKDPVHYRVFRLLGSGHRELAAKPKPKRPRGWQRVVSYLRSSVREFYGDAEIDVSGYAKSVIIGILAAIFLPLYMLSRLGIVRRRVAAPLLRAYRKASKSPPMRAWKRAHKWLRTQPRRMPYRVLRTGRRLALRSARAVLLLFHRPLCFLDYYIRAYRLVRHAPTDVYHAHDLNALPVAWWARRRFGGKLVYDSHEIYTETTNMKRLNRKIAAAAERFFIRRADEVITIHDTAAEELARRYAVPVPSVVRNCPRIPPGCERTSRLQEALGLKAGDLIVLYQGGFALGRGLHNLLRAMVGLPDHMKLVMMGWGKIELELRSLAEELGLLDRQVFFFPPVPQEDLLHWTASAHVGVIPYQAVSLNNYLCMPNKLFEYMGAGLPVVASAFPELSRVIDGSSAGVTFDPEEPASIAAAMNKVLSDADLRARMSENARKAALVYNWENEEKTLLAVYARMAT